MLPAHSAADLDLDALYLGVLTARGAKPLSRLEYPVAACILEAIAKMGLAVEPVTRVARNGSVVVHWVMARDRTLIARYRADFAGTLLELDARTVRLEAWYFGYPACCAEAYLRPPPTWNDLPPEEQRLLFHRACPGCQATPRLIPLYRSALAEAERLYRKLRGPG